MRKKSRLKTDSIELLGSRIVISPGAILHFSPLTLIAGLTLMPAQARTLDATGLPGLYEVETEGWASLLLKRQLGLKLEKQKAPLEVLTVEHVEIPVDN
jgi:hypothetical protein